MPDDSSPASTHESVTAVQDRSSYTMATASQPPASPLDGALNMALRRVTYRRGWQMWVTGDSWAWTHFPGQEPRWPHLRAPVEDSNDPNMELLLDHSFPIPPSIRDEHEFFPWLAECLIAVERHESREFFKVDGQRFLDPHRANNTRLYA